jgi:hypothetical protein
VIALGIGGAVPVLLALGTNLPLYEFLWRHFPPLRYPRVPERLMPVACLAIAALVAYALQELFHAEWFWGLATIGTAVAVIALAADLRVTLFGHSPADEDNPAYAALRKAAPGRVLELPVFLPDVHLGSPYLYYTMQARRQRPGGYSTTAPVEADQTARRLRYLNCGDWTGGQGKLLRELGVSAVTFHLPLYTQAPVVNDPPWFAWRELVKRGWQPRVKGDVVLFTRGRRTKPRPPTKQPPQSDAVFCEGWYPQDEQGRQMSQGHSPFWVFGSGILRLIVRSSPAMQVRISVDGEQFRTTTIGPSVKELRVPLGRRRWHLVSFDGDLPRVDGRAGGARVIAYARS